MAILWHIDATHSRTLCPINNYNSILLIALLLFSVPFLVHRHHRTHTNRTIEIVHNSHSNPSPSRHSLPLVPKVALLFLVRGEIYHEQLWSTWFQLAHGLLPRNIVIDTCESAYHDHAPLRRLQNLCTSLSSPPPSQHHPLPSSIIASQALFTVYIHTNPDFKGYSNDSMWRKHRIPDRIPTAWGDHSLSLATRALIFAAFSNPSNQRFVLLSETDIPLYDPLTLYLQLMLEQKSRINACPTNNDMPWRWSDRMTTPRMNASHWRKSSQWFSMLRKHAKIVLLDQEVNESFNRYCKYAMDEDLGRVRDCISDEHYLPTLFAVHELEHEMDCQGWGISALDWSAGGAHPKSYSNPSEITVALVHKIRETTTGNVSQWSAGQQFISCSSVPQSPKESTSSDCSKDKRFNSLLHDEKWQHSSYIPLFASDGRPLPLTARKFPDNVANAVKKIVNECDGRVGLLSGRPC